MSKMDRMRAAMMGEDPAARGSAGCGGGGRGTRARAPPNPTAGLAGGGSAAERDAVAACANVLAREHAKQKREETAPAAQKAAAAGHKTAVGDLDPNGPPSPASKKRKVSGKAKDTDRDAPHDEVRIVGETFELDNAMHLATQGVYIHSLATRGSVLASTNPSFVVVYDPDAAFIREIETHKASRPGAPMRVYFLVHDTSLEEQRYLSSVRHETEAFDNLIRTKQHMAIPREQEGRVNDGKGVETRPALEVETLLDDGVTRLGPGVRLPHGAHAEGLLTVDGFERPKALFGSFSGLHHASTPHSLPLPQLEPKRRDDDADAALNTRRRGGQLSATSGSESKLHLVVDVREFMSSLPSILHQSGFVLKPATIEVGDYVLSPDVCVERKAIPDLVSSLQSGRLYNQASQMLKHYKIPILLIEFDKEKAFGLQSLGDLSSDITVTSTQSRLCLLVLAFPRLRLLWSRSLHATAEMFRSMKIAEPEPTVAAAVAVGVPQSVGVTTGGTTAGGSILAGNNSVGLLPAPPTETPFNQAAIDVLRRLPGITDGNYRRVLDRCETLADLTYLSKDELSVILGDQRQAKTLFEFMQAPFPTHA